MEIHHQHQASTRIAEQDLSVRKKAVKEPLCPKQDVLLISDDRQPRVVDENVWDVESTRGQNKR